MNAALVAVELNATTSILGLIGSLLFAYACYRIAASKGRSTVLWAVLGFFFTIISLIIVLVLPSEKG